MVFVCPSCPLVTVNEKIFEAHRKDHEDGRIPSGLRNDSAESPKSNQPHTPPADDSSHHSSSVCEFVVQYITQYVEQLPDFLCQCLSTVGVL